MVSGAVDVLEAKLEMIRSVIDSPIKTRANLITEAARYESNINEALLAVSDIEHALEVLRGGSQ